MGHIRNAITLALIAAVATGCVADAADPGDPFALTDPPEDEMTCLVNKDWAEDTPYSRNGYHLFGCWLGSNEDDPWGFRMSCAKADGADRYVCVESMGNGKPIPGMWYSHEGGTRSMGRLETSWTITLTGGTFTEHDCADERDPLLELEWCAE